MSSKKGINVIQSIVLSLSVATAASASEWIDSPVARAWQRVTGSVINIPQDLPVLDGNILRIIDTSSGNVRNEFVVVMTNSVPLESFQYSIDTTWGHPIHAEEHYSISSGFVVVNGEPEYFAFMQADYLASTRDAQGTQLSPSATIAVPILSFDDSKRADAFIASADTASDGAANGGGILCHDPTWLGRNGVECCGYLSSYQSNVEGCRRDWWKHLFGCVGVATGGGWAFFQWCVKTCIVVPPPGNAGCAKACLIASSAIGIEGAIVCILAANEVYEGCVARERGAYILNLTNNLCELREPSEGN